MTVTCNATISGISRPPADELTMEGGDRDSLALLRQAIYFTEGFPRQRFFLPSFKNNVHSNTVTLSYALNDRFSIFGGFTYDSIFAAGDIVYVRGTPPLNDFLRDQETDRVLQAGVEAKPAKRFGLRLTGNFDRSTGLGQISGEPPAYGPLTWPLVTGTVYFDFPKAGRLSVDLQRTYYIEQIVTGNNFSANLLTIRWTREF